MATPDQKLGHMTIKDDVMDSAYVNVTPTVAVDNNKKTTAITRVKSVSRKMTDAEILAALGLSPRRRVLFCSIGAVVSFVARSMK